MDTIKLGQRKYEFSEVLETNISTEYLGDDATNWGIWEMMRESFQNIMDEAQHSANGGHLADHLWVDVTKVNGNEYHRIRDKGRGADLNQILYLGWSGKRGKGMRGEKGEGQLLAFLVGVKEEIDTWFVSKDYAIRPFINTDNGHPHLALQVYRTNKEIIGTQILVEKGNFDVGYYITDRKYFFPDLKKPRKKTVRGDNKAPSIKKSFEKKRGGTKLYMKGIYVKDINALFSYNLKTAKISRDRDMVSEEDLLVEIREIWNDEKRHNHLVSLISTATGWGCSEIEMRIENFDPQYPDAWRSAFRKVAGGRRAVLWTDDIIAREARRSGYKVLKIERSAVLFALAYCGIKFDHEVASKSDPCKILKTHSAREGKIFRIFDEIAGVCGWNDSIFEVFKPTGRDSEFDNRLAFYKSGVHYFRRSHIEESTFEELFKTFLHEETHRRFGAPDESREFESGQAQLWLEVIKNASKLVLKAIKEVK